MKLAGRDSLRIDPTFPNRRTENYQDSRKILQRLGETAGVSRTHSKKTIIEENVVAALGMSFADVEVRGTKIGDTVEVGGPSDLPFGITVTGNVLRDDWVQLRAANCTGQTVRVPGREFKIITRGFGDG